MKKVEMFIIPLCPYCIMANKFIKKLIKQDPKYAEIEINTINENKQMEYANKFDYYFVPTIYVDGEKKLEGVPTLEMIKAALDAAL